jgi:hypothetical protein
MKSNNWDFDINHYIAEWNFFSKRRERKGFDLLIRRTIEVLINEGVESQLLYVEGSPKLIEALELKVHEMKSIELISIGNEIRGHPEILISAFDNFGEIKELKISTFNIQKELQQIKHYKAGQEYIPLPFDIVLGIRKNEIYLTIHLNWDIWFEYVLCEPKWYAKYDANDIMGPDEEIDYRKHAFSNVELAKINGSKFNEYLKRLKTNSFMNEEFTFEFYHTDQWPGYHKMTNANGIELLD